MEALINPLSRFLNALYHPGVRRDRENQADRRLLSPK
jgi:hypothetical protein